jgi:hypothetical protein
MPDVVAALAWAREHDHDAAFRICRGLAPIRSSLGHLASFDATLRWLIELDVEQRGELWAEALAGALSTATSVSSVQDTVAVEGAILAQSPDGSGPARSWLERGRAMVPAYCGRPSAIMSYADALLTRSQDLEASVYVGFTGYMLALMGRLDECEPRLQALRRLTRRHGTTFSVDSVGNGYAAAIVVDTLRGDLGAALERGRRPLPSDPAFSMTSAAALAHAALLASDRPAMERAIEWSTLGSLPLLQYLSPFTGMCAALLDERHTDAADLAHDFWEQSTRVPVWRLFALPLLCRSLAGRQDRRTVERWVAEAGVLANDMERAPNLNVSLAIARAQLALACDQTDVVEREAAAAYGEATRAGLPMAAVDALDLRAAAAARRGVDGTRPADAQL